MNNTSKHIIIIITFIVGTFFFFSFKESQLQSAISSFFLAGICPLIIFFIYPFKPDDLKISPLLRFFSGFLIIIWVVVVGILGLNLYHLLK